jgi:hypothetical protein
MKEIIYLTASRSGIDGSVRKNLPINLRRGEVPIKVVVQIADDAFAPPVIEQHISIQNPYKGIDLEDVHFEGSTITEGEAEIIRRKRLEKAASILEANGYTVTQPASEDA